MTGWQAGTLFDPETGAAFTQDTPHSIMAAGIRWPVVEGIPFLRANRRHLADAALALLDAGDTEAALVELLADQDDWARSPPACAADRRRLVRTASVTSFRAAMDLLAFGPVGTYFAHRWSDPTFLSGLALAEAHGVYEDVFELACGAGHFLRDFGRGGRAVAGGDVVFAKLWLARRYIAPHARLVCFDAAGRWPFADAAFRTVFCHDAFYFLPDKPFVAGEMRRVGRSVLVGHAHNALVDNLSSGAPLDPAGYARLFDRPLCYDDRELTAALVESRAPRPVAPALLDTAPAVSFASGTAAPAPVVGGVAMPPDGAALRRNPLYQGSAIAWPSERYAMEYAKLVTYPPQPTGPETAVAGHDAAIDELARCRVLLDLPRAW